VRDGRFWKYPWMLFEIFSGTLYNEAGLDPVIAQGSEGEMMWRERSLDDKVLKSGG
jgi:hypothetical protein